MKPLIKASNINVFRKNKALLQDVSMVVDSNDFVTVVGPNGAGKSLLMKCLMGLVKVDSGTIYRDVDTRIGYVPQRLHINRSMPLTSKRFLTLNRKTSAQILEQTIAETDVEHLLDKPLYALSGGELQRILLARSLLSHPTLLVLDEPAQNLDITSQLNFYKQLEQIYENRDIAILMVSHDLHLVIACSKTVICLNRHICCMGETQMVTQNPEFISLFGQDMANHVALYHHDLKHDHEHEHTAKSDV